MAQTLMALAELAQRGLPRLRGESFLLEEIRLEDLVAGLLDMDAQEAELVDSMLHPPSPFQRTPESFHAALQEAIRELRLFPLFARTRDGVWHRSLCPAAYDELTGLHHPGEMARWRADYRSMAPERQMVAATLVWLYRGGADSIWLRRVPCTWRASEALHYMRDAGCLGIWLRLIARYPGW